MAAQCRLSALNRAGLLASESRALAADLVQYPGRVSSNSPKKVTPISSPAPIPSAQPCVKIIEEGNWSRSGKTASPQAGPSIRLSPVPGNWTDHPVPGWRWPSLLVHRCGGALAPENTPWLGLHCRPPGVRAVEFDVTLSRDKLPVLIHDEPLRALQGVAGAVPQLDAEHLLRNWMSGVVSTWPLRGDDP